MALIVHTRNVCIFIFKVEEELLLQDYHDRRRAREAVARLAVDLLSWDSLLL